MPQVRALTKEQAVALLPDEFRPATPRPGSKQLVCTPKGLMAFHQSSLINDGYWKTSHNKEEICAEIDYVLFAIGYEGILILPKEVLLSFCDDSINGKYSNNRYKINIRKDVDRLIWQGKGENRLDVTDCFVGGFTVMYGYA